jgi:hypothetical protein
MWPLLIGLLGKKSLGHISSIHGIMIVAFIHLSQLLSARHVVYKAHLTQRMKTNNVLKARIS